MQRRAQATLFIILGIILLFVIGSGIYYYRQATVPPIERAIQVPADRRPIYDFVAQCVNDITTNALVRMGLQGGYLTLPPSITQNPFSYLPLDPAGVARIPYWYYEAEDRTPSTDLMAHDLALRIKDDLRSCTDSFRAFEGVYSVTEKADPLPEVTIAADNVIVDLTWPLELQFEGRTLALEQYVSVLDVPLRRIWQLANRTMAAENRYMLFENLTVDLLSMHPDIPTDGMVIECGRKTWRLDSIQESLQTALYYNIPRIRVQNTNYLPYAASRSTYERVARDAADIEEALQAGAERITPPANVPGDAYEYFRLSFDVGAEPTELRQAFTYRPEWGMRLVAQPHDGGLLHSTQLGGAARILPFLCVNQWHFSYSIIYPVLAVIKSPTAFGGAGYTFQFAFPVLINRNQGERTYFGLRRFEPLLGTTDFCNNLGSRTAEFRARGAVEGSPIGLELDNVNISLDCGGNTCLLGATHADEGIYRLRTYLPDGCSNPRIRAHADGYLPSDAYLGESDALTLDLRKLSPLRYSVVAHAFNPADGTLNPAATTLPATDRAHIRISVPGARYDEFREYPARPEEREVPLIEERTLYDIDVFVSDQTGQIVGGYQARNISISGAEVAGAGTIEFHVLRGTPSNDQQRSATLEAVFAGTHNDILRPTLR